MGQKQTKYIFIGEEKLWKNFPQVGGNVVRMVEKEGPEEKFNSENLNKGKLEEMSCRSGRWGGNVKVGRKQGG